MKRAKDIMRKKPESLKSSDTIQKACRLLINRKISGAPVVNESNKLVGFVSEKDIIKFLSQAHLAGKRVINIMTKKVFSVDESGSSDLISKIFSEKPFKRLPVTSKGKLTGIIDRTDIMDNLLSEHY